MNPHRRPKPLYKPFMYGCENCGGEFSLGTPFLPNQKLYCIFCGSLSVIKLNHIHDDPNVVSPEEFYEFER